MEFHIGLFVILIFNTKQKLLSIKKQQETKNANKEAQNYNKQQWKQKENMLETLGVPCWIEDFSFMTKGAPRDV
jgi:hypothetical protein